MSGSFFFVTTIWIADNRRLDDWVPFERIILPSKVHRSTKFVYRKASVTRMSRCEYISCLSFFGLFYYVLLLCFIIPADRRQSYYAAICQGQRWTWFPPWQQRSSGCTGTRTRRNYPSKGSLKKKNARACVLCIWYLSFCVNWHLQNQLVTPSISLEPIGYSYRLFRIDMYRRSPS